MRAAGETSARATFPNRNEAPHSTPAEASAAYASPRCGWTAGGARAGITGQGWLLAGGLRQRGGGRSEGETRANAGASDGIPAPP
jgi:hypothetical protein